MMEYDYIWDTFRQELYKTPSNVYKFYLSPEIQLTIKNNIVYIHDFSNNQKFEEIEDSEPRGYLNTSACFHTSKLISLLFKKHHIINVLIISRSQPMVRKTYCMHENSLIMAKKAVVIVLERNTIPSRDSLKIIQLQQEESFKVNSIAIQNIEIDMKRLLDVYEEKILIMTSRSLVILEIVNLRYMNVLFELDYTQPSVSKVYKQYLITLSSYDGKLQIRDTVNNEENTVYTQKSIQAVAETLTVKYDKVFFWERGQINIIFLDSIEKDYEDSKYQAKKATYISNSNLIVKSRFIKGSFKKLWFRMDKSRHIVKF